MSSLGAEVVLASVDPPSAQLAMNVRWHLPFRWVSDPGGERFAKPLDAWNPDEHGGIFRPLVLLLAPDGRVVVEHRSQDFADRRNDDDVLQALRELGLPGRPVPTGWEPDGVEPQPTDAAFKPELFTPYFLGVKFSSMALRGRMQTEPDADEAARTADMGASFVEAWKQRRAAVGE